MPLYVQGTLGKSSVALGAVMLFLSLGWSLGALLGGRWVHRTGQKPIAVAGAGFLIAGNGWMLVAPGWHPCFYALTLAGLGMGFVSIATLLTVQDSLEASELGIATSCHQFARTFGGTIGVGVCGGFVSAKAAQLPPALMEGAAAPPWETLLRPELRQGLSGETLQLLQDIVARGVTAVFWIALLASVLCLVYTLRLPGAKDRY